MESETTHNGQSREDIEDLIEHCIPRPPLPPRIDDTVFQEISYLLDQHPDPFFQKWGSNPRTYTLLRMLGYDEDSTVFTTFDLEQIGDVLLPLWPKYLPKSLTDSGLSSDDFRRIQPHVLSRPELLNESNFLSNVHSHRYIIGGKAHFDELEELGHGGSAKVERVRHKLTGKCFACKRISRGSTLKVQRDQLVEFEQELNILKRVRHKHIVNYVGSYTDFDSFSLILSPVADLVLKALLQRQDRNNPLSSAHLGCLRSAFGCLATAIAFVHDERIRHKDIKPGNILISQGKIYLCDFGISRDWSMNDHSTTEGPVPRYTPRYAAPEVTDKNRRNESWDIWSLGCVFLEMITVIEGYPLSEMDDFLCRVSGGLSVHGLCYASNEIRLWLNHLRSGSTNNTCLDWISDMVEEEAEKRPKAKSVVQMIQEHSHGFPASAFIGQCCMRFDSVVSNDQVNYPALQVTPTTGLRIDFNATPCGRDSTQKSPATPGSRIAERPQISRDRSLSPKAQENARGGSVVDAISLPPAPGSLHGGFSSGHASTHSLPSSKASRGQSVSLPEHSTASSRLSPIPHPSELQVDCLCGSRSYERHIFNAKVSFYSADESVRSIETCERCEVPELRVQLYETPPEDPSTATVGAQPQETLISKVWWITRRLVISHCADSPAKWRCCSFWLPLADLSFQIAGDEVTLAWSDCNQMRLKSSAYIETIIKNWKQHLRSRTQIWGSRLNPKFYVTKFRNRACTSIYCALKSII
ncbi:kinase-like protein [Lepidopterella palustris CBS 459.81]|uniref:Kinase-like protein n=1 Tax=Lepidopterella palustris CBS 459.81 TaxID=1314670 RepID=A0A8E2E7Z0_9PEZI|nr:kinase-like protein [Lepidopterella palustris CBS 459.81]